MQSSLHAVSQKYGFKLAGISENRDEAEMIAFGLEIFLGGLIKVVFLFSLAMFFDIFNEAVVVLTVIGTLRTLSGGAHCTAYYRCMLVSTCAVLSISGIVQTASNLLIQNQLMKNSSLLLALLLLASVFIYWSYSPQPPVNKPLSGPKAVRKFRALTVGLALFYSGCSMIIGTGVWVSWAVAVGMFWQAATLTGMGYSLVSSLDKCLIYKRR